MNIKADGTIPTTASDGLNNVDGRPIQIYTFSIYPATAASSFTRLTTIPPSTFFLGTSQPLTTNSSKRTVFNFSQAETGAGNPRTREGAGLWTSVTGRDSRVYIGRSV